VIAELQRLIVVTFLHLGIHHMLSDFYCSVIKLPLCVINYATNHYAMKMYGVEVGWMATVRFPAGTKVCSVQTDSGAHPASYPLMGTQGLKRPERETNHSVIS
jgi:hypothetical protein